MTQSKWMKNRRWWILATFLAYVISVELGVDAKYAIWPFFILMNLPNMVESVRNGTVRQDLFGILDKPVTKITWGALVVIAGISAWALLSSCGASSKTPAPHQHDCHSSCATAPHPTIDLKVIPLVPYK